MKKKYSWTSLDHWNWTRLIISRVELTSGFLLKVTRVYHVKKKKVRKNWNYILHVNYDCYDRSIARHLFSCVYHFPISWILNFSYYYYILIIIIIYNFLIFYFYHCLCCCLLNFFFVFYYKRQSERQYFNWHLREQARVNGSEFRFRLVKTLNFWKLKRTNIYLSYIFIILKN